MPFLPRARPSSGPTRRPRAGLGGPLAARGRPRALGVAQPAVRADGGPVRRSSGRVCRSRRSGDVPGACAHRHTLVASAGGGRPDDPVPQGPLALRGQERTRALSLGHRPTRRSARAANWRPVARRTSAGQLRTHRLSSNDAGRHLTAGSPDVTSTSGAMFVERCWTTPDSGVTGRHVDQRRDARRQTLKTSSVGAPLERDCATDRPPSSSCGSRHHAASVHLSTVAAGNSASTSAMPGSGPPPRNCHAG